MMHETQPKPTHSMCMLQSISSFTLFAYLLQYEYLILAQKPTDGVVHSYSEGAAKEAGKQTVKYVAENPDTTQHLDDVEAKAQQGYDDAKAQAQVRCRSFVLHSIVDFFLTTAPCYIILQGMWAKYCGCFSSVA
jgi:hypothetical protein